MIQPGSTLLRHTDGLVERRDDSDLETLLDAVSEEVGPDRQPGDVAELAVRVHAG